MTGVETLVLTEGQVLSRIKVSSERCDWTLQKELIHVPFWLSGHKFLLLSKG